MTRGCHSFQLPPPASPRQWSCSIDNRRVGVAMGMSTVSIKSSADASSSSKTEGELENRATGITKPRNSKFAALMAGEVSSPSGGFEPISWEDEGVAVTSSSGGNSRAIIHTTALPDDDMPSDSSYTGGKSNGVQTPASLHNKRTLYWHPSLLTPEEAASLLNAAERSGKFDEFDSRCAVIVEDGVYQEQLQDEMTGRGETLASLLHPILTSKITPFAREMTSIPTLTIADALIRSYDPAEERQDLAVHYDITSYATMVIPLNDPNEYEGGLYVQYGASCETRRGVPFTKPGEAVLHRYDVMHGVNVRSGRKRCSLVVWFGENEQSVSSKTAPWVKREAETGMSVHAAFLHGMNSQNGLYGFEKDMKAAKEYFTWASERGHAISSYCLSNIVFKESFAQGVKEERQHELQNKSLILLESAAKLGLASAQHELGIAYKQGYRGVARDVNVARSWLSLAATQGHQLSNEVLEDPSRWIVYHD